MNTTASEFTKVRITVCIWFGKSQALAERIYFNEHLRVHQVSKWRWYFNYILAKQIMAHPKSYCRMDFIRKIVEPTQNDIIDTTRKEVSKLKGKITKAKNKLAAFEANCKMNDTLNIDPYVNWPSYKTALCKIQAMEKDLLPD